MKSPPPLIAALGIFLLVCILTCGCSRIQDTSDMGTTTGPASGAPIIGAWVSGPREPGGVQDLSIFKESGRFDATVIPGAPAETLLYEVYLQGSWEETSANQYLLIGEEITHFFTNDTHSTRMVRDLLRYDPRDDRLYRESDPANPLERISHEATIPPGMNVSIPWD